MQIEIKNEKGKWEHILKVITWFLINLINLISNYDFVLSSHLKNHGLTTYLSNKIQNEFIKIQKN